MSLRSSTRHHSVSPLETHAVGRQLAAGLSPGAVVLLIGPLGAGKTVLAKGIARGLGIRDEVVSPTYTIVSEYRAGNTHVYHVDLYRIEGRDQLENLGLDDLLRGDAVVIVEWGEKLDPRVVGPCTRVTIGMAGDGGRDILVEETRA
ncbi:MAG TPA: tRNA (adenosine(37)-N6)-threonylcarbamoyltransferase complex ATPase subunit type 1 TsaE [Spirochaetia bacterium]|nr:tRNA (adenosine(37)-N6)-threonylcarbamoyltransferase complex ATPase subunit type 1 TsaE [Spirochaetia bacterium]